jgi:phosphoribosylanthranilate isomerase
MMVKICGITTWEDATAAVVAGATALGFNFYPKSPRYISPEDAAQIIETIPDGIVKVGVFVNEQPAKMQEIATLSGIEVLQLHGDETPESLTSFGGRIWKAFCVDENWNPDALYDCQTEAVLLDGPHAGSGQPFDWTRAKGVGRKIILAGGLDASNVATAIRTARPWGVDACSRLESSPGRKDHKKMQRFIEAALSENL